MVRRVGLTLVTAICAAAIRAAPAQAAGQDNAANPGYADGWQAGDNGGSGFGPWTFSFSGDPAALVHPAPQFIAEQTLAGNALGPPAFALTTSNRPFFSDTSAVGRQIGPLAVGDTLRIDLDGSELETSAPPFTIGNTLRLIGADGVERFGLFTNNRFNNNQWTTEGAATGVAAAGAFTLVFTLTAPDAYDVALLPVDGEEELYSRTGGALRGTAGAPITRIFLMNYGTGSSADGTTELFFDNLAVQASADFDGDLDVDGNDLLAWQRGLGKTVGATHSDGDANGDGAVNALDLSKWNEQFGAGGLVAAAVPEPSTVGPASIAAFLLARTRRRVCVRPQ